MTSVGKCLPALYLKYEAAAGRLTPSPHMRGFHLLLGYRSLYTFAVNQPSAAEFDACPDIKEYLAPLVSFLRARDITEAVEDSSGNAGASFAAYAAAAGIKAQIYVPAYASGPKRAQIEAYGAEVISVPGPRSTRMREHGGDIPRPRNRVAVRLVYHFEEKGDRMQHTRSYEKNR